MNESEIESSPQATFDLGRAFGQRRAFAAVGGRCSAANARLLQRIRDEKLYLPVAGSWRAFCDANLSISRRHADYLIGLLNRFGPIYFELSELMGLSVKQYLVIEPAVREQSIVVDGAAISVIPENANKIFEAVSHLLSESRPARRPRRRPQSFRERVADLTSRASVIANELVALYDAARSERDRELVLESATQLRLILMQPGLD